MALTRIKVKKINDKLEIIGTETGIYDDNPVIYYGNEDQPIEDNVKPIARGLDEFKEYLKKKGQPLIENPQDPEVNISVRIPRSYAKGLRATGRGWKTKVGEYLVNAIKRGEFGKIL